ARWQPALLRHYVEDRPSVALKGPRDLTEGFAALPPSPEVGLLLRAESRSSHVRHDPPSRCVDRLSTPRISQIPQIRFWVFPSTPGRVTARNQNLCESAESVDSLIAAV